MASLPWLKFTLPSLGHCTEGEEHSPDRDRETTGKHRPETRMAGNVVALHRRLRPIKGRISSRDTQRVRYSQRWVKSMMKGETKNIRPLKRIVRPMTKNLYGAELPPSRMNPKASAKTNIIPASRLRVTPEARLRLPAKLAMAKGRAETIARAARDVPRSAGVGAAAGI